STPAPPVAAAAPPVRAAAPEAVAAAAQAPRKVDFGSTPLHIPVLEPEAPARAAAPARRPIRLRTWLMVFAALGAIWMLAKPGDSGKRLAGRVEAAVALTADCRLDEARGELAALKSAKATAAQLQRLQGALSETLPGCEKKRLRAKAWKEAGEAAAAALDAGALEKAAGRLAAFTRRWGEDGETRALDGRIDAAKAGRLLDEADACLAKADRVCLENRLLAAERLKRPELAQRILVLRESLSRLLEAALLNARPAAQAPAVLSSEPPRMAAPSSRVISTAPEPARQGAQQARKILADAERELERGNYRGAIDKVDTCATMIDVGNRDCLALKQKAERLNRDMLRCVANGAEWVNERCN
ncbi:hypothetical protein, partial [Janthinobacterium sp.]|uniref:hypothetical protein n=1 Tax=Janthinobacterium sp. TaxID=1871054 RepID=UPI00293D8F42